MKTKRQLTIGLLSAVAKVNVDTIRYYERIGILPKPPRSASGRRLFADEHTQRLIFIRRARELGFSLNQVWLLLGMRDGRCVTCGKVKSITEERIAEVRREIKDLKRRVRVLNGMVAQCHGDGPDCPILDALVLGGR